MTNIPGNQPPQGYPSQPIPPPYPPYPPGIYPPPKQGPSALKIVLIVVGIFFGLSLIGLGILGYGVYKVAKSATVTTNSPPLTESDLGVAIYPGAEQSQQVVRMTLAGENTLTTSYLTTDSKDKVIAFYQGAMGSAARSRATADGESIVVTKGTGESVMVTVSQSPSLHEGKTQIVIAHATPVAAPTK
jgi:hypothetical protein